MLRKLFLTAVLLAFFAPAAMAGNIGKGDPPQQQIQQMPPTAHIVEKDDGISSEVLAALIAGGLGLLGVVITAVVTIQNRKK